MNSLYAPIRFLAPTEMETIHLNALRILAEVGMRAGLDSKKSDVLGLAVRGGSVLSHVRWGARVASPVVRAGDISHMLAFEPLEALRGIPLLHPDASVLCNTQPVMPISVSSGSGTYPTSETIESSLTTAAKWVRLIDATAVAVEIGNPRVTNVVMLGAFSCLFDIHQDLWEEIVLSRVPAKYVELNRTAFRRGRKLVSKESP